MFTRVIQFKQARKQVGDNCFDNSYQTNGGETNGGFLFCFFSLFSLSFRASKETSSKEETRSRYREYRKKIKKLKKKKNTTRKLAFEIIARGSEKGKSNFPGQVAIWTRLLIISRGLDDVEAEKGRTSVGSTRPPAHPPTLRACPAACVSRAGVCVCVRFVVKENIKK